MGKNIFGVDMENEDKKRPKQKYKFVPSRNKTGNNKVAEKDLDNLHNRIKLISAPAGQLIQIYDLKSGKISWAGNIKAIMGYSAKEIPKDHENRMKLIHPDDVKNVLKVIKNAQKTCSPYEVQYRFLTKNKVYITVSDKGFFIPDRNGKAAQIFVQVSDISNNILSEKKIKESEKEFLSIVNEMPHFIYRINLKGEITFANDAYRNLFGYSFSEILGKTAFDLHPKGLSKKYTLDNKKVFKSKKTFYTIEENVNIITGRKEIVEVYKIPLFDNAKKIIGLQGVYWNVTDKVLAQKTVKSAESNYKEIFNSTGEAIFIHNAVNGRILDVNETAAKMYGYSRAELCSLTIDELSAGDNLFNKARAVKNINKAPSKGSFSFEWRAKKKNGKLFWVEVALRKSKIGGKGRVLAAVRDISKRKEDEKALLLSQISINTSKDAVIWFNKFGRILYVNNAALEMLGYSKKEIYSLSISAIENINETDFWKKRLNLLNKKGSLLVESFFVNKKKDVFPVEMSVNYYNYENDEFIFAAVRDTSERKKAEERLRESEKRFRDMTELLPQGIYECDLNGKVTYGNKKILEILQYTVEDMKKGFYVMDSVFEEDKQNARENIKSLIEGKIRRPHEYKMIRKDGTIFPASIYSSLIDEDGVPKGVRGIIVDLSEKKAVEKEKQERDNLFTLLFEKAGDANLLIEGDQFIDCNETTVKVLNARSKDDIINTHPWEISPEYQPDGEKSSTKAGKYINIAFKEGSHRFEWVHKKFDDVLFYVEVVLTAIPIGGKWYLHTAWRDITDKKNAEQKEKIFYQRLEKLLEIERKILSAQSTEEIARAALKHLRVMLECDRASIVLFDKGNDEFTIIAMDSIIPTKFSEGAKYKLSESLISDIKEGGVLVNNDFSQDGTLPKTDRLLLEEGILSRLGVPLVVRNRVVGSLNLSSVSANNFNEEKIKIAQDVSVSISLALQHSSFIEQINNQNLELEKRIDDRTVQLRQTISELESFSYSVSHDLRAPLRSIGGFSQAIIDDYSDKLDEEGNSLLKRIINASQRMSDLIDAMLMLARITRSEIVFEKVDISALVSSVANEIFKYNEERNSVEFFIQPGLYVKGDQKLLRIAIENLMNNAWKFTKNKDKTIIEFGQTKINDEDVFYIKDNGVGFDMEYSNKLFGAFQRLHNRDEFEGTGIGLATTKRIILRHNGTIWAESRLGEESIFYFTIGA